MQSIFKGVAAGLAMTTLLAGAASAELSGDLRIFFDDQNPAPKAAIEGTVERFQACTRI